jgi:hypothetical protein
MKLFSEADYELDCELIGFSPKIPSDFKGNWRIRRKSSLSVKFIRNFKWLLTLRFFRVQNLSTQMMKFERLV